MTNHDRTGDEPRFTALSIVEGSDHIPPVPLEPLIASTLDSAETETRTLRRDGWTPERKRLFQETLAQCGTVSKACRVVGMSAQAAYALRNRDPLFGAGWDTALLLARQHLADDIMERSLGGVIERIYKNGEVVAERHRYDNRLSIAMLNRLDARADRAERLGAGQHALAARWADYLDALGADRRADALALINPEPEIDAAKSSPQHQFHQLSLEGEEAGEDEDGEDMTAQGGDHDGHIVWEEDGAWWTDYPPPPGFDGVEYWDYGHPQYSRALTAAEEAAMAARNGGDGAETPEIARRRAERARDLFFGLCEGADAERPEDEDEEEAEDRQEGFDTPPPAPPSDTAMNIRNYTPADAPALAALYARSVRHFGPRGYSAEQVEVWAATACPEKTAARCADGRTVLIAEDADGTILGFGDMEADGHLDFLYTAPEGEGRGVGSALYAALEDAARASECARIFVEASELARPLFERRGYTLVHRNDFEVAGVAIHNYSMEKALT
ncbi:GNAT family N-acetyltransferase [Allosphingosinicella vermicomposti]|uniref:GNAT family N-acetyltransferase n=1 Tax=Allosphingosinicella vermicomposti TaxID=614671 RepID=UPI0018F8A43E|nr:GNAT family N-acetyltransferase [Allosphingosinicella vermicomposti]